MSSSYEKTIKQVKKSMQVHTDIVHVVTVFNCNDQFVCNDCRKLEGRHYHENIFKLPDPKDVCTCELGCRCWTTWIPSITHEPLKQTQKKKTHKKEPRWRRWRS